MIEMVSIGFYFLKRAWKRWAIGKDHTVVVGLLLYIALLTCSEKRPFIHLCNTFSRIYI